MRRFLRVCLSPYLSLRLFSSIPVVDAVPPALHRLMRPDALSIATHVDNIQPTALVEDMHYDVIVVGGGHAGCEAAAASARVGAKTLLITQDISKIGEMSCNPSIGGLGKGTLVREIDSLDGLMARAADMSGLQYRTLNTSKGAAVRAPRLQCDRRLYKLSIQQLLCNTKNLYISSGSAEDLIIENNIVKGIKVNNMNIFSKTTILATGTFLRGRIHIGSCSYPMGRFSEGPAVGVALALARHNVDLGRMSTGTPPRLDGNTIDFSKLEIQNSSNPRPFFSYLSETNKYHDINEIYSEAGLLRRERACYGTYTTNDTHKLVSENLNQLPKFSIGENGRGNSPRYCPSIETKIRRFPNRPHHVWLEPEGIEGNVIYPQGLSTGLPEELQLRLMRTIPGLEHVEILRPGYQVEYDYCNPEQLHHTLENKKIASLFLCGQINGTTGYEEAGAQGIIAGINAGLKAINNNNSIYNAFILDRSSSLIGVMIDDLISKGVTEPYRMFTSRAEYRLSLRADNADRRLTEMGWSWSPFPTATSPIIDEGCIVRDPRRIDLVREKHYRVMAAMNILQNKFIFTPPQWRSRGVVVNEDGVRRSAVALMAITEVSLQQVVQSCRNINFADDLESKDSTMSYDNQLKQLIEWLPVYEAVEIECKYSPYLSRQEADISTYRANTSALLPEDLDYASLKSISTEERQLLCQFRPLNLAEAERIEGLRPSTLVYLLKYVKATQRNRRHAS